MINPVSHRDIICITRITSASTPVDLLSVQSFLSTTRGSPGNNGTPYATEAELVTALQIMSGLNVCPLVPVLGTPCLAGSGAIDDLAKFNLTFFIDPNGFTGDQLTLRFESAAVPEPSAALLGALGCLVLFRRKR